MAESKDLVIHTDRWPTAMALHNDAILGRKVRIEDCPLDYLQHTHRELLEWKHEHRSIWTSQMQMATALLGKYVDALEAEQEAVDDSLGDV